MCCARKSICEHDPAEHDGLNDHPLSWLAARPIWLPELLQIGAAGPDFKMRADETPGIVLII